MSGDPQRVIDHLHSQINELRAKLNWMEDQIGPANLRYSALKDQYDTHLAEAHFQLAHTPCVAPTNVAGTWGVYCEACSHEVEDYVYPCRLAQGGEWPPRVLVPVAPAADTAPAAQATRGEQGDAHDEGDHTDGEQDGG